jgi:hypothetical protein
MTFVSITRLRLRSPWLQIPFFWHALRSGNQARSAPGNLAFRALADARNTFWTATLWSDEASMRAYMVAGPHKQAMPKLIDWCDEASVVHWTQDSKALPDWTTAWQRMVSEGRPSKVRQPSARHLAREIPRPRI